MTAYIISCDESNAFFTLASMEYYYDEYPVKSFNITNSEVALKGTQKQHIKQLYPFFGNKILPKLPK